MDQTAKPIESLMFVLSSNISVDLISTMLKDKSIERLYQAGIM